MRISASLIGIALMLGVAGCELGDEATFGKPEPTTGVVTTDSSQQVLTGEERVSQWIMSCEVREILFAHDNVAYIRLRDGEGRRVRLGDDATADRVFATAAEQRCPDFKIIVAIE